MTNTTTSSRTDELRAALSQAEADLADARERLGVAVADADDSAASVARTNAERLERLVGELRSALPIAECRDRQARDAEAQRQQRAREKAQNKARKARIAAAKKFDKLLAQLGRAFVVYLGTEPGGSPTEAARLARRSRHAASAALFHHAPELAIVIEPRRRPMRAHYAPLADAVEGTVREFEVEDDQ